MPSNVTWLVSRTSSVFRCWKAIDSGSFLSWRCFRVPVSEWLPFADLETLAPVHSNSAVCCPRLSPRWMLGCERLVTLRPVLLAPPHRHVVGYLVLSACDGRFAAAIARRTTSGMKSRLNLPHRLPPLAAICTAGAARVVLVAPPDHQDTAGYPHSPKWVSERSPFFAAHLPRVYRRIYRAYTLR